MPGQTRNRSPRRNKNRKNINWQMKNKTKTNNKSTKLIEKLVTLGFVNKDSDKLNITIDNYCISINLNNSDLNKSIIDYGTEIKVWNKVTSNFYHNENLVVLECVLRLLKKGYLPKLIELEKTWKSGRGTSGRLDILIRNSKKGIFAMIECKTWSGEYEKERNKILENGGQLFSYAVQERSTKYLLLYSSQISSSVDYQTESIDMSGLEGTSNEELHQSWDKTFMAGGIFTPSASCFNTANVELKKQDLKELDDESGQGLFHSFAEILRRHAVSDKSNAFNKIFNLFVCKIYDEDTHCANDILDFQWKPNDDYQKLISRLSELYQKGIGEYLELPVESDYFSPYSEFAFVDIYNKKSFNENFKLVREIVELLQRYQLKYTQKHQFLGDFFEDLLNSGIKQEAGQFFTPTPLARFFIRSIPVESMVTESILTKKQEIIPSVIDFACGAGHFLTEAIDEIETIIQEVDYKKHIGRSQKHFLAIRDNYYWAKDYVYGIEKDYRLSKTTKIALFLNGDGDAVIVNADGFSSFSKDSALRGALHNDKTTKELSYFDILISNPPFSISGFAKDIKHGKSDFDLFNYVSHKSKEIECLFLERAYQLLKEGGYMGIILPLSILNNENSVYINARRILLIGFCVAGIIELRDKTFKPTNTTTVSIFAWKRKKSDLKNAANKVLQLLSNKNNQLSTIAEVLAFNPDIIKNQIKAHSNKLKELKKEGNLEPILGFDNDVFQILLYILDHNRNILLGYSGEKKDQEHFLGYRFSKSRGQEGIEILRDDTGNIDSKLYDSKDRNNQDKISFYIQSALIGKPKPINASLKDCLKEISLDDIVSNEASLIINNPSKYFTSRHISLSSISPLGDFIDDFPQQTISLKKLRASGLLFYTSGLIYSKREAEVPYQTDKRVLTASNISLQNGTIDLSQKLLYLRKDYNIPDTVQPKANDIIISNASGSIKHLGKVALIKSPLKNYAVGGFLGIYRFKETTLAHAVYYRLMSAKFRMYVAGLRGQNINNLDIDKVDSCVIEIPKNLKKFIIEANRRERQV